MAVNSKFRTRVSDNLSKIVIKSNRRITSSLNSTCYYSKGRVHERGVRLCVNDDASENNKKSKNDVGNKDADEKTFNCSDVERKQNERVEIGEGASMFSSKLHKTRFEEVSGRQVSNSSEC